MFREILLTSLFFGVSWGAICEFIPPLDGAQGPQVGFIFTPGAQIAGERYKSLAETIQRSFPGQLWVGLTEGFFLDFPNPLEIGEAINQCRDDATAAGYDTTIVFNGAHSLGGIVLEAYMLNHAELTSGLIMYGTYLPDLTASPSNVYPVPVLTAVGSLDGGVVAYTAREARESAIAEETNPGWYPVFVIDRVNHAQVFDGLEARFDDITAEIPIEEAHQRYADAAVAFMVTQYPQEFDNADVDAQKVMVDELQAFTDEFLAPFNEMFALEQTADGSACPWMIEGQKMILAMTEEETAAADLTVNNVIVTFGDLGAEKPNITGSDCSAEVNTIAHPSYDLDPIDAGAKTSARVIKAKFKLEDTVLEAICLEPRERVQCRDINAKAFDLAWEASSEDAKTRYTNSGKVLKFVDDKSTPWGPGWEFSGGLNYTEVDELVTELQAVSLITEGFIIPLVANMHYCDLLSPLRALEWIYITSQAHQF